MKTRAYYGSVSETLRHHLAFLYGEERAAELLGRLLALMSEHARRHPPPAGELTERDALLITYGDQVRSPGEPPLRTLAQFMQAHLPGLVSGAHILPFYPYSSDDGFSVIDYRAVDPDLGGWGDVERLSKSFDLMFDAVVNHISASSHWFQGFLRGEGRFADWFIVPGPEDDLSQVVRPRALPLLTRFQTAKGPRQVWTTFSADQVDLNFQNPEVLLEVISLLLFYVACGARFVRLDAIAFLWKQPGTTCIHLPQTHRIVKLFRTVLEAVAPQVRLITETNVPHRDNMAYFGDGTDETHMVYQFALPPLVLNAILTGRAEHLTRWAADLDLPSNRVTFFNFLASHDGVGLNPARGILSPAEIDDLVDRARAHGGLVSSRSNPDGTRSPYELNINYFDALSGPDAPEPLEVQVDRFMVSQAIMLALRGVPGIYFHSLFGSRGWPGGVAETGRARSINRQKLQQADLEAELAAPTTLRSQVFRRYAALLRTRASSPAFNPHGRQRITDLAPAVFAVLRTSPDGQEHVLCLHNLSSQPQRVIIHPDKLPQPPAATLTDPVTGRPYHTRDGELLLSLAPYQVLWLKVPTSSAGV